MPDNYVAFLPFFSIDSRYNFIIFNFLSLHFFQHRCDSQFYNSYFSTFPLFILLHFSLFLSALIFSSFEHHHIFFYFAFLFLSSTQDSFIPFYFISFFMATLKLYILQELTCTISIIRPGPRLK